MRGSQTGGVEHKLKTQLCSKCEIEKPLDDFSVDRSRKTGIHSHCKACQSARIRAKRKNDTEWRNAQVEKSRQYKILHPEKYKQSVRNSVLKAKYGMTTEDYEALFDSQGRLCAVCKSPKSRGFGRMHVDHCHKTGNVRGILCQPCNTSLGKCNDDPEILRKLAEYLEVHGRGASSKSYS
jgi:hypothetical protein